MLICVQKTGKRIYPHTSAISSVFINVFHYVFRFIFFLICFCMHFCLFRQPQQYCDFIGSINPLTANLLLQTRCQYVRIPASGSVYIQLGEICKCILSCQKRLPDSLHACLCICLADCTVKECTTSNALFWSQGRRALS